jgi:hypothetical protein
MLKFTDKKRAQTLMDSKVKMMVSHICAMWDTMDDFERLFPNGLEKIKKTNHINPVFAYKLVRHDKTTMEVWHVPQEKMIHDRLLCEVSYVPEEIAWQ